jgi:hypothetical protein
VLEASSSNDGASELDSCNTNSMQQSPTLGAERGSVSEQIPRPLWNQKIHYHVHNISPVDFILSQSALYFLKLRHNVILRYMPNFSNLT